MLTKLRHEKKNIFEDDDDQLLFIECDCPSTTCNYRCPYCFLPNNAGGYLPFEDEFIKWKRTLFAIVKKIKRPLILSIGPSGEPLFQPKWWEAINIIKNEQNIKMITFVTNLSFPIQPFLMGMNPNRIGIAATLHPTQFKNPREDFDFFLKQTIFLKKIGIKIVINYVFTPYQISDFPKYHKIFSDHGILITGNLFRGAFQGKNYPEKFADKELEVIRQYLSDTPFIFDYQSRKLSPFGNKCTAGRYALNITFDGKVFPCYFVSDNLGSVFDDELYIYNENITCSSHVCECKWTIPLQQKIVERFKCIGNVHEIIERKKNDKGFHPFI